MNNMKCALCDHSMREIIKIAETPPANELLLSKDKVRDQDFFPLNLRKCEQCNHLQLDCEVPKTRLFSHYVYVTDTGSSNRAHFKDYAEKIKEEFNPKFVLDIGSNDGLFLSYFNDIKVLGIDPATNIEKKVETLNTFFDHNSATFIREKYGKPDVITCNNMFAHNRSLSSLVRGVKSLLDDDGVFVVEVAYAMEMLRSGTFDQIYHEHYHYWTVTAMRKFFNKFQMKIQKVEKQNTHGGSIRVFVRNDSDKLYVDGGVDLVDCLIDENENLRKLLFNFPSKIYNTLENINLTKDTVVVGYPAKACTFLHALKNEREMNIKLVFDDNKLKQGKFTHFGQFIQPIENMKNYKIDNVIICSWNYSEQIVEKLRKNGYTGTITVPFEHV